MTTLTFKNYTLVIVGLGYVGLPLAVEFGKYRKVIGFDININRINELKSGIDKTLEISSKELISAKYLCFTSELSDIDDSKIYIITVPTPINSANQPNLKPLKKASELVAKKIKKDDVIIYESTVYPGATEEICVPILEKISGLQANFGNDKNTNLGFYVGYSPERINPGDKERRLPDIVKVTSGSTPAISLAIDNLYKEIIKAGTHLAPCIKVAEAAKVIENTQRDLNIAFINELSMIFSKMNIDTYEVLEAACTKWNFLSFKPGLVGGHCIGVDPYYLTYKADMIGYKAQITLAGRRLNDNMARLTAQKLIKLLVKSKISPNGARIGVLGLSFKANCPDIRNTKVIDMVLELEEWGAEVLIHDDLVNPEEVLLELGRSIYNKSEFQNLDGLILAVGHQYFYDINLNTMKQWMKTNISRPILIDLSGKIDKEDTKNIGFNLVRL